ncbi:uncharacterized protein LOC134198569 [Corticium candelabrum]|uniref:uncharacterized protein LOC134198569 n=1 Tax=Corticium candelabrum TaxID=121492 RepID=UPI002E270CEB|nr:uncharacterized protein LOC134198569 [Corticium candelabrum]
MHVEQEFFQWKVAAMLGRVTSEVELSVFDTVLGTEILLRLSTLAGLELLKVFASEKLKHDFGRGIAEAMSSKSERTVAIMVEISNLQLEHMKVVPTGTFHVESAKSIKDSTNLPRSLSASLKLHTDDNPVTEVYIYEIMKTVMNDYKLWIAAFITATVLILFVLCLFLSSITADYYRDGKQTKQSNSPNDDSNAGQACAREIDAPANKIFEYKELEYNSNECFIGRGGFADVFKAVLRGNKTVAFKKPNIGGSRFTDTEMKDLIRESDILLAIPSHEHIVEIIGICIDSRHFGIVLEYVDGGDLCMLLSSHTSDPYMDEWKNKLDVSCQIADGFKHLHGLHPPIIHRDLKPSNILVKKSSAKYTCKITDFGLAKIRATSTSTGNKSDGNNSYLHAAGSVAYIAPERYEPRHLNMSALAKSDVYSFGVILFQFRERIRPFGDEENVVVIALNVKGGLPYSTPVKRCPCGYDELMRSCCSLNGGDRPAFTDILPTLHAMSHDTVS